MQYINKDKLIKVLQMSKSKDFDMKKLERIIVEFKRVHEYKEEKTYGTA